MSVPATSSDTRSDLASAGYLSFRFDGTTTEYTRIWIVNTLLSIVTVGLYSPWAKVRRKRYFLRNTTLLGSSFDFHADPIKILKGRLLIVPLFIGYSFGGSISPGLAVVCGVLLLALMPWVVVRSARFNAINTSYRNLRFRFASNYARSIVVFWLYGLAALLSLGLLAPIWDRARRAFAIDNHAFGSLRFRTAPQLGEFYIGGVLVGLVLAATTAGATFAIELWQLLFDYAWMQQATPMVFALFAVFAYTLGGGMYNGIATRAVLGTTTFGQHTVITTVDGTNLAWLVASNFAAMVGTLGLASPWVAVRTARFWAEHIALNIDGSLDAFVAELQDNEDEGAAGEEFGEMFDVDFGF